MAFTAPTRTLTFTAEDTANLDHYAMTDAQDQVYDVRPFLSLFFRSEVRAPGVPGYDQIDAILRRLGARKPHVKTESGLRVEIPLSYGTATNAQAFRYGDTLSTTIEEGLTRIESLWAFYTTYAALYQQTVWENSGPGAALNRQKENIDLEMRGLGDLIGSHLVSTQGDVSGSQKFVPGLQNTIDSTVSSGTLWGLSRSSPNTFWRNNIATGGSFATGGLDFMRNMRYSCSANGGALGPNLIISPSAVQGYGIKQLEGIHRVTDFSKDEGNDLSAPIIRYMGIPWIYDDDLPSGTQFWFQMDEVWAFKHGKAANYVEHPPSPNNALIAEQTRLATGLTWGIRRPDKFGRVSSITA